MAGDLTMMLAPDLAAQQMASQRQQALAQMLTQQGQVQLPVNRSSGRYITPIAPSEGMAKLANAYLGGQMMKSSQDNQLAIAQEENRRLWGGQPPASGAGASGASNSPGLLDRISNGVSALFGSGNSSDAAPSQASQPMPVNQSGLTGPWTSGSGSPPPTATQTQAATAEPVNSQSQPAPISNAGTPTPQSAQSGTGMMSGLTPRGMSPQAFRMAMALSPDSTIKTALDQYSQTPEMKNLAAAYGVGSPQYIQGLQDVARKAGYIAPVNVRAGGVALDGTTGKPIFSAPNANGGQIQFDAAGNPSMAMVPGAAAVNQTAAYAQKSGQGLATPQAGYDANNKPVFTNQTAAAGGNLLPNPNFAPPSPSGVVPSPPGGGAVPGAVPPAGGTPAVNPGRFGGYQAPGAGPVAPALAPGVEGAASKIAGGGADRFNTLMTQAADSPTRVNVLDNIINLSKQGVDTGPGQDWKNVVKGYVANTPALGDIAGKWKDDASGFQELQKFTYQNALRNWQAAGGTGTDSQMEAASNANPNDHLFPQALQQISQWGKASELALQAKAKAANQFLGPNPAANAANLPQFENTWNQNFDPRIYQMSLMSPQDMQKMTQGMSNVDRQSLIQKVQFAKQNGWIQ